MFITRRFSMNNYFSIAFSPLVPLVFVATISSIILIERFNPCSSAITMSNAVRNSGSFPRSWKGIFCDLSPLQCPLSIASPILSHTWDFDASRLMNGSCSSPHWEIQSSARLLSSSLAHWASLWPHWQWNQRTGEYWAGWRLARQRGARSVNQENTNKNRKDWKYWRPHVHCLTFSSPE